MKKEEEEVRKRSSERYEEEGRGQVAMQGSRGRRVKRRERPGVERLGGPPGGGSDEPPGDEEWDK